MNGDGMADIVGFGNGGRHVALATGGGKFGAADLVLPAFGAMRRCRRLDAATTATRASSPT